MSSSPEGAPLDPTQSGPLAAEAHLFSSDRPITRLDEDKLDRRAFAEQIAHAIRQWNGNDSLVIALYGSWGTGKSSIKNMVIDALRATPESATVIDFNPWQVASRAQLSEAFFDEIGIAIGKGPVASRKYEKRALSKWKRYAARLRSSKGMLTLLINPIRWILIISAVLLLGSAITVLHPIAIVAAVVYLIVALLTWSSKFAEQVAAFHEAGTETQTLEEVKADVRKELYGLSAPILVLIDDLDRLTPSELLEMFQLVKANGDFPNIVYLLLCDRSIVEKHIAEVIKGADGRDYLEKIVQVPFDVPLLDTRRVREILFVGLNTLLADAPVAKNFDTTRWGNLLLGGLGQYFRTLRQVNRFLSSLSFHMSTFKSDGSFEVNVLDLIALETLRLYEPTLYQALRENKKLLTSTSGWRRGARDSESRKVIALLGDIPTDRVERAQEIIKQLFPTVAWAFGGSHYESDWTEQWYRELRICSEDVFDRYFLFGLPSGDLSQAAMDRLLAVTGDRVALRSEFDALASKNLLEVAMDRLEAYKQQIPVERAIPFVAAIFDVGDQLSDESAGIFEISPAFHAERIVYWYLKQEPDVAVRGQILRAAIEQTEGLRLPVGFLNLIDPNRKGETSPEAFVTPDVLQELKDACVLKITSILDAGLIPEAGALARILYSWRAWVGPKAPAAFCATLINTTAGLLQFLRAFLLVARTQSISDRVATPHWYMRSGDIEAFVPFDSVESKVNGLPADAVLSVEDERAISAFKKAAERRRTGRPDDGPHALD